MMAGFIAALGLTVALFVASEALAAGYGGIAAASRATGMATSAIGRGLKEVKALESGELAEMSATRSRRAGGGRKKLEDKHPELLSELKELIEAGNGFFL